MQLGSIIFTVIAAAATLIHAAPVPVEDSDFNYCTKLLENIDSHMRPTGAELSKNLPTCTDLWYQAAADCGYKVDQRTKIDTVLEEHKSCFEEMFLKYKTQGSKISRRDDLSVITPIIRIGVTTSYEGIVEVEVDTTSPPPPDGVA